MITSRKTVCPLDCPDACGIEVTLKDKIITRLKGDNDHPFTQGFLCKKVSTYHHRVQSDDRVLFPQRRISSKGEARFERISWDSAWDILVNTLTTIKQQYGGDALLPYTYAGNMGLVARWAGYPFFHKYGASQLDQTICSSAAKSGWATHYGHYPSSPPEKVLEADLILAWGIDIKVTNVHFMPMVLKARRRGARLVVIDPYQNATARAADHYFPIKPGGDTALALALLKKYLAEGHLDQTFIRQWTDGFAELTTYLDSLSLNTLIDRSGMSREHFDALASLIGNHPKTFIRLGIGLTRNTTGAMSARAICCLAAALGLFDGRPGKGALLISTAFSGNTDRLTWPSLMTSPTRKINMVKLGHALTELTPPIKGLFIYGSNPLSVAPDAGKVRQGLQRDDLFTVVHEQFVTPTARYADLLLPATTSFENADLYTGYGHFYVVRTEPIIAAKGEAISNFDLFQTLAQKMGYDDPPFRQTLEQRLGDYIATLDGLPDSQKQSGMVPGQTVTSENMAIGGDYSRFNGHRFQFANPAVQPPIPTLLTNHEFDDPELTERYPLQLITPPMLNMLNSTFGERYVDQTGTVLIHPADAGPRGIITDSPVELFNYRGKHRRTAIVSEKTQPGLLVAEGLFWENQQSAMTNINDLTSQAVTDLGEGGTFHESRVDVRSIASDD